MPLFSDTLFRGLDRYGYNVLRRPTGSLAVFDLLGRDDVLERIGPLQTVATLGVPLPAVNGPMPAANVAGQISSQVHITTGLGFLQQWLRALSGVESISDLAPAFPSARFLEFVLEAPAALQSDRFAVANVITSAALNPGSTAERYAKDRYTDLVVVTDTMQTDRIGVRALDLGSAQVRIDVPALVHAAGANIMVSTSAAGPSWVTCQGRAPVTFAFRCLRVRRGRGPTPRLAIRPDDKDQGLVLFAPGTSVAVA